MLLWQHFWPLQPLSNCFAIEGKSYAFWFYWWLWDGSGAVLRISSPMELWLVWPTTHFYGLFLMLAAAVWDAGGGAGHWLQLP